MKGKRGMPPKTLVGATMYRLVLFKVEGRDALGRPRDCRLVRDEETLHIEGGEEFFTAYVAEASLRQGKDAAN